MSLDPIADQYGTNDPMAVRYGSKPQLSAQYRIWEFTYKEYRDCVHCSKFKYNDWDHLKDPELHYGSAIADWEWIK